MNNRVPLPAGTTLGKSYEYGLDINLATFALPSWQPLRRISGYAPTFPPATTDVTTYDDLGATNEDVTGRGFAAAFTVQGNRSSTTGLFLPEVEALIAAGRAKMEGAVVDVRFYHKPESGTPSPTDAGRAQCRVEVSRQNTGNADIEVFAVTLTGKGEYEPIANPFTGWGATAPLIAAVGDEGTESGDLVTLTGSGFLGATAVTFDGIASPDFEVVNAASIIAVLPADGAGIVPVIVTTPAGASAPFGFTRGA